jgi:ribonuclease Z
LYPDAESDEEVPYLVAPRSIVILGDTCDPTAIIPLVIENHPHPVSLLVHEATDAYIPPHIDPEQRTGKNRTEQSVMEKAVEKGHSTPAMAGLFAKQIGAQRLALNHIGSRYASHTPQLFLSAYMTKRTRRFPAPPLIPHSNRDKFRRNCMAELETQANKIWQPKNNVSAIAVSDFDRIVIQPNQPVSTMGQEDENMSGVISPLEFDDVGHMQSRWILEG